MMISLKCNDGKEHTRIEDDDAGEIFCSKCGIVLDERITSDIGPRNDIGDTTKLSGHSPQVGISTVIPLDTKLMGKNKTDALTLRKWDSRIRLRAIPTNKKVMDTIASVGNKMSLPQYIVSEVERLALKMTKQKHTRGRTYNEMIAGCIIAVCRREGITKSMGDIGAELNVTPKRVFRMYRIIKDLFDVEAKILSPADYIPQIGSKLNIPEKIINHARKNTRSVMKTDFHVGRSPIAVASTMLYISVKMFSMGITQKQISAASDITEISIRNTYKMLREKFPNLFDTV